MPGSPDGLPLGHLRDPETGAPTGRPLHLPPDHLTTHAACIGMTGSGKTGLCIGLLEEAALAGIPALVVDPKGDMANLALAFPGLSAAEFAPWVAAGADPEEEAARWRAGLSAEGLGPPDVARYRDAARVAVFTPGSTAGLAVDVLASLAAPPPEVQRDREALLARVGGTVAALLGLVDHDGDPVRSPAHALTAAILLAAWEAGRDVALAGLIAAVQQPAFATLGALPLETVMPRAARDKLALALNGVLAAPGFERWRRGTPLDVDALALPGGRPRLAVLSIAHLDDRERLFFVTLLLEQLVTWMRRQAGSPHLRLLLYFDEIAGYLPPHPANPSSKAPLLVLLKQARAFGVGVMLVTQNPVDLDYKALANAGVWLIGRLQTEQDRERLLGGIGGAAARALAPLVARLERREFVVHDVRAPVAARFASRFVRCYLPGPLTLAQIRALAQSGGGSGEAAATGATGVARFLDPAAPAATPTPPVLPAGITQLFLAGVDPLAPHLYLRAVVGYRDGTAGLALTRVVALARPVEGEPRWSGARRLPATLAPSTTPPAGVRFGALPPGLAEERTWRALGRSADDFLARECPLVVARNPALALTGEPDEPAEAFAARCRDAAREQARVAIAALEARAGKERGRLEERLARERRALAEDTATRDAQVVEEGLSWARTVGEALFSLVGGRRRGLGRIGSGVSRSATRRRVRQRAELAVAATEAEVAALEEKVAGLERETAAARTALEAAAATAADAREPLAISPQKSTMHIEALGLLWGPATLAETLAG